MSALHYAFRRLAACAHGAYNGHMDEDSEAIETPEERERLLAQFPPDDWALIERVMPAGNPPLTAAEAIKQLRAGGGL